MKNKSTVLFYIIGFLFVLCFSYSCSKNEDINNRQNNFKVTLDEYKKEFLLTNPTTSTIMSSGKSLRFDGLSISRRSHDNLIIIESNETFMENSRSLKKASDIVFLEFVEPVGVVINGATSGAAFDNNHYIGDRIVDDCFADSNPKVITGEEDQMVIYWSRPSGGTLILSGSEIHVFAPEDDPNNSFTTMFWAGVNCYIDEDPTGQAIRLISRSN